MSLKSIICINSGYDRDTKALNTALELAKASRGQVRILHISTPPSMYPAQTGIASAGLAAYGDGTTINRLEQDVLELRETAHLKAQGACRDHGVAVRTDGSPIDAGQVQATLRTVTSTTAAALPAESRSVDVIICGYDGGPGCDIDVPLEALFSSGRPVLMVPSKTEAPGGYGRTVVIAWDGSLAAARALRDSIPHMLHAKDVYLLRVCTDEEIADPQAEIDALDYLRSHCIEPEVLHLASEKKGAGPLILNKANALKADLLVMGAYGHGHMLEMLLGGVTDYVVKHAAFPLLLSH